MWLRVHVWSQPPNVAKFTSESRRTQWMSLVRVKFTVYMRVKGRVGVNLAQRAENEKLTAVLVFPSWLRQREREREMESIVIIGVRNRNSMELIVRLEKEVTIRNMCVVSKMKMTKWKFNGLRVWRLLWNLRKASCFRCIITLWECSWLGKTIVWCASMLQCYFVKKDFAGQFVINLNFQKQEVFVLKP